MLLWLFSSIMYVYDSIPSLTRVNTTKIEMETAINLACFIWNVNIEYLKHISTSKEKKTATPPPSYQHSNKKPPKILPFILCLFPDWFYYWYKFDPPFFFIRFLLGLCSPIGEVNTPMRPREPRSPPLSLLFTECWYCPFVRHSLFTSYFTCNGSSFLYYELYGKIVYRKWTICTTDKHKRKRDIWLKVKTNINIHTHIYVYLLCIRI